MMFWNKILFVVGDVLYHCYIFKCFIIAVIYVSDLRELHLGRSAYIFSIFCNSLFWNVPIPLNDWKIVQ